MVQNDTLVGALLESGYFMDKLRACNRWSEVESIISGCTQRDIDKMRNYWENGSDEVISINDYWYHELCYYIGRDYAINPNNLTRITDSDIQTACGQLQDLSVNIGRYATTDGTQIALNSNGHPAARLIRRNLFYIPSSDNGKPRVYTYNDLLTEFSKKTLNKDSRPQSTEITLGNRTFKIGYRYDSKNNQIVIDTIIDQDEKMRH